ncbi:MAG: hypothetical protein KIT45_10060 [Fimbriimonadia bacterium]|nr:hypothetical protein [Fimbriimonadia bacterium]
MSRLQRGNDAECSLFQKVAEQGHYAGRRYPTDTRQGTYMTAPSGVILTSVNTNDARQMERALRTALDKWNQMPKAERYLEKDPAQETIRRPERFYPKDGLALKVYSRDLPRENIGSDWRSRAWNQDFAWFRKEEARQFLPARPQKNAKHEVPRALIERLIRTSFVDNVRGQTSPYRNADEVKQAVLTTTVEAVKGSVVTLKLEGATRAVGQGVWAISGYQDMNRPTSQERGYESRLLGKAKYDLSKERFIEFELVSAGTRWGGTQYNGRGDDLKPAPMGFVLQLAGTKPADQVAPEHFWSYGWQ